ncbi:MAG TPA: agmatinase [Bdellovibrionota bacterium]|nr:agmatinase [Bdellovibrionota bacterium]
MAKKRGKFQPLNPRKSPRFGDIATFNRLPYVPDPKGQEIDVAILGIPFDGGVTYRPGARFGPRAVREASVLSRNYHPQLAVQVYERLNVVDGGDISTNPLNMKATSRQIHSHLKTVHAAGARAICVGGDHSITFPELRATHEQFGDFTLVHFDAHYDLGPPAWDEDDHHGTWVRRGIEEKFIKGSRVFQIGIRQPLTTTEEIEYVTKQGVRVLDMESFHNPKKREAFLAEIRKSAGSKGIFISFDIDVLDPAYAPGTGTPVVGGMTTFEALQALRALSGLKVVGADVTEICPAYDHAQLTSLAGAAVVFELLGLMAADET